MHLYVSILLDEYMVPSHMRTCALSKDCTRYRVYYGRGRGGGLRFAVLALSFSRIWLFEPPQQPLASRWKTRRPLVLDPQLLLTHDRTPVDLSFSLRLSNLLWNMV